MADVARLLELIELVGRKLRRRLLPILEGEGVSMAELFVLRKVQDFGKCRVTELADDIGIPPSTLTGITDRLVSKGMLSRGADPEDRRAVLLEGGGELPALLGRVQRTRKKTLAGVFGALSPEHLDRLVLDLEELLESLEREEEKAE